MENNIGRAKLRSFSASSQRALVMACSLIACFALIWASCIYAGYGYDFWWHLRLGTDWIELGLSPWVDHHSFTYYGNHVFNPPFMFEVALHAVANWFGEEWGRNLFRIGIYSVLIGFLLLWFRAVKAPALVIAVILPLMVCAIQLRVIVRPEILGYVFSIIALLLYHRTRLQLHLKTMVPIALLLAFWSAYHSPVFGYIIFFGLFIDIAVRMVRERAGLRAWGLWCGYGLLMVAAGFLNSEFEHFLLGFISFSGDWDRYIWEYRSAFYLRDRLSVYLLLVVSLVGIILSIRQEKLGYMVILLIMLGGAFHMMRLVPPAGVISVAILAHLLAQEFRPSEPRRGAPHRPKAVVVGLCLLLTTLAYGAAVAELRQLFLDRDLAKEEFPEQLVDFMNETEQGGRVFHLFRLGGYLMHKLSPEFRVYIDGRTHILYPFEHYERYAAMLQNTVIFLEEVERYSIDHVVLPATEDYATRMQQAGFGLSFVDIHYALYRRTESAIPALGLMWALPNCAPLLATPQISEELDFAASRFPDESALAPILPVLSSYVASHEKRDALEYASVNDLGTAHFVRTIAYLALDAEAYELAIEQFKRLENLPPRDQLAYTMAQVRSGEIKLAVDSVERILREISSWTNLEMIDLVILRAVIDELEEQAELPFLTATIDEGLTRQVGSQSLKAKGETLSGKTFCTEDLPVAGRSAFQRPTTSLDLTKSFHE